MLLFLMPMRFARIPIEVEANKTRSPKMPLKAITTTSIVIITAVQSHL